MCRKVARRLKGKRRMPLGAPSPHADDYQEGPVQGRCAFLGRSEIQVKELRDLVVLTRTLENRTAVWYFHSITDLGACSSQPRP